MPFIELNRWEYKEERGLHIDCNTPQLADTELKKYLVSTNTAKEGKTIVVNKICNIKQNKKQKNEDNKKRRRL